MLRGPKWTDEEAEAAKRAQTMAEAEALLPSRSRHAIGKFRKRLGLGLLPDQSKRKPIMHFVRSKP